jgi:nucleotide-binding universal stress UspA family protein
MTVRIERIVVALDAASENRAAIDTAVRLAALWKARLHGVFVEDDDLLRLANLPFARQVSLGTGVEQLTLQLTERQLRAFAESARRELAAAAQHRGVAWSFDIVRGALGAHATGAAESDFLVAGVATRPIGGHFRLECRWWSAIEPASSSFLLSSRTWDHRDTVVAVIHNRGPIAERLLDTAARLAEANGGELTVICPAELSDEEEFAAWLGERLAGSSVPVEVNLTPDDPAALIRRIAELDGRLVAIAADSPQAQPANLRRLVSRTGCDVLVVR